MIYPEDVRKILKDYRGLDDENIQEGINAAQGYLNGINPEWEKLPNPDTILKLASAAMVLQLNFPNSAAQFESLDQKVREMVTSIWSSSYMQRKRTGYGRLINNNELE